MSFTDQKPKTANERDVSAPWGGAKNGKNFRCYLCGHRFQVGDQYRFVFGQTLGNFMVCQECDTGDVLKKWADLQDEWNNLQDGKFWYFSKRVTDGYESELHEVGRESREAEDDIQYWKDKALYGGGERRYG